jgi:putative hydrolase of the HAD superfamily
MLEIIAFDADDTLWHNERLYSEAQTKLAELLSRYNFEDVEEQLYARELKNIPIYGYGIKSFTLSMIELSIELTEGAINAADIAEIIGIAKGMLTAEVDLFEHAESTVKELARDYDLMVITKGDLLDQESKLKRSGIGTYFRCVEIVSEKSGEVYSSILKKYNVKPENFLMVGNSLRSDVAPVAQIGGHAVYVPYHLTWAHENLSDEHVDPSTYHRIENLGQLPALVVRITNRR